MKKILGILLFIGIALNANAQLLWKISGNGLEKPSYILGTHHLAPLSIKDSIAGLPQAVDGTSQVYGEVVMSEAMSPEFMQTMQQNMMMAGDTTLQVLFTPEQYELVGKAVKENLMADIAMLAKMKPAFITQQLTLILCMKHLGGFNPQEQLDTYFQQQAIQSGKKVGGLETPISQINVLLNSQTLQRQANLLYCLVSDIDKAMDQTKRLNNAYKAQNLDEMLKLMEERDGNSCDPQPGEMEDLLDNRNKAWIEKMPSIIDYTDRATCPIFGDGAAAFMLEPTTEDLGVMDSVLRTDGKGLPFLHIKAGGSVCTPSYYTLDNHMHYIYQEGRTVFKYAVANMANACEAVIERNHLSKDDIDWVIPHQANQRIITAVTQRLEIPTEKVMVNIERYGNTSAATLPLCIWDFEDKLKKGDNLIFTAFGAGFAWGAIYVKWGYDGKKG